MGRAVERVVPVSAVQDEAARAFADGFAFTSYARSGTQVCCVHPDVDSWSASYLCACACLQGAKSTIWLWFRVDKVVLACSCTNTLLPEILT